MGSNPVESPEFFRFMRQLLKLSSKCEDHIFTWFQTPHLISPFFQRKKTSTTFLRGSEITRVQYLCPGSVGPKKDFSCQLFSKAMTASFQTTLSMSERAWLSKHKIFILNQLTSTRDLLQHTIRSSLYNLYYCIIFFTYQLGHISSLSNHWEEQCFET